MDREALEADGDTIMAPRVTTGRRPVVNKKRPKQVPEEQIEIPLPQASTIADYKEAASKSDESSFPEAFAQLKTAVDGFEGDAAAAQ